jgi:hypothetical protein
MVEPEATSEPAGGRLRRFWRIAFPDLWLRTLLLVVAICTVLAMAGGFGTGEMPPVRRFAFWLVLAVSGFLTSRLAGRLLIPRPWYETRTFLAACLMVLIVGLPMTLASAILSSWIGGQPFRLARLWGVAPSALAATAGTVLIVFLVNYRAPMETHRAAAGAQPPRFLARLPARLAGAELWAVEAEDHYLRLHTSKGQDLILMRLADALVELEGIEGARTHRSWWVARAAVQSAERAEGRATLTLQGDLQAPVSRAYVGALREAGWF